MESNDSEKRERSVLWQVLGLAWNLGYIIALPLVVFALGGRLLDTHFGTSPLGLLAGIFISLVVTSLGVMRKIKVMMKEMEGKTDNVKVQMTNEPLPAAEQRGIRDIRCQ